MNLIFVMREDKCSDSSSLHCQCLALALGGLVFRFRRHRMGTACLGKGPQCRNLRRSNLDHVCLS